MKKNIKNTFLLGCMTIASALSSQAALVYSTDFDPGGYVASGSGAHVLGGATPDVTSEDWFGSTNGVNTVGDITLNNATQNRYRAAGVWLDTTGWASGLVTVEVDVANYIAGADTTLSFQAYAATGVDGSNSVSLDLHAGSGGPVLASTGAATIAALGAEQTITADGTDLAFTFNYNGTDDFVGLVFAIDNVPSGTAFGSADIDNLTVNTVPEPSSTALLGLGGLALILRRRK